MISNGFMAARPAAISSCAPHGMIPCAKHDMVSSMDAERLASMPYLYEMLRATGPTARMAMVMFSDLTRKVTMQNLFHDGGFSSMGMSLRAMATYEKGLEEYMDDNGNIIYG